MYQNLLLLIHLQVFQVNIHVPYQLVVLHYHLSHLQFLFQMRLYHHDTVYHSLAQSICIL
ncbi:unnamed protein product [Trichobilharzia regenti]|nr:unnamed protein product [Trichobilharzia regenti]